MNILEAYGIDEEDFVWQDLALCQNIVGPRKSNGDADDPLFDSYENSKEAANAVDEMCERCPVRKSCLIAGVDGREQGVWGGVYLMNGKPDKNKNDHKTPAQWAEIRKLMV